MAWMYLILAGACEVAATTVYRYSDGLTRAWPTFGLVVFGVVSLYCLHRAVSLPVPEAIPVGTAYAVWTGVGAAGTVLVGIAAFGESADATRIALLVVLIGSIAGLKLVSGT
ncbi:MAG: multidrug efflux SMR transporter [Alphaproteobacteria bacterium]|nr:multidrug efflux SMR transporter [Alphaproteobacteria bacterium]